MYQKHGKVNASCSDVQVVTSKPPTVATTTTTTTTTTAATARTTMAPPPPPPPPTTTTTRQPIIVPDIKELDGVKTVADLVDVSEGTLCVFGQFHHDTI